MLTTLGRKSTIRVVGEGHRSSHRDLVGPQVRFQSTPRRDDYPSHASIGLQPGVSLRVTRALQATLAAFIASTVRAESAPSFSTSSQGTRPSTTSGRPPTKEWRTSNAPPEMIGAIAGSCCPK